MKKSCTVRPEVQQEFNSNILNPDRTQGLVHEG